MQWRAETAWCITPAMHFSRSRSTRKVAKSREIERVLDANVRMVCTLDGEPNHSCKNERWRKMHKVELDSG